MSQNLSITHKIILNSPLIFSSVLFSFPHIFSQTHLESYFHGCFTLLFSLCFYYNRTLLTLQRHKNKREITLKIVKKITAGFFLVALSKYAFLQVLGFLYGISWGVVLLLLVKLSKKFNEERTYKIYDNFIVCKDEHNELFINRSKYTIFSIEKQDNDFFILNNRTKKLQTKTVVSFKIVNEPKTKEITRENSIEFTVNKSKNDSFKIKKIDSFSFQKETKAKQKLEVKNAEQFTVKNKKEKSLNLFSADVSVVKKNEGNESHFVINSSIFGGTGSNNSGLFGSNFNSLNNRNGTNDKDSSSIFGIRNPFEPLNNRSIFDNQSNGSLFCNKKTSTIFNKNNHDFFTRQNDNDNIFSTVNNNNPFEPTSNINPFQSTSNNLFINQNPFQSQNDNNSTGNIFLFGESSSDSNMSFLSLFSHRNSTNSTAALSEQSTLNDSQISHASEREEVQVHYTRTGRKYHRGYCGYLHSSDYVTTLSKAKSMGLTPCSRCGPPC